MLRQAVNELEIQVEIEGKSHLLIKDGRYDKQKWAEAHGRTADMKALPAMIFISNAPLGPHFDKENFYLPGSSMRGCWRSHLEKVLRSLDVPPRVCDPFADDPAKNDYLSCSSRLAPADKPRADVPYKVSCPVCQLFGNSAQGSRLAFSDGVFESGHTELVDNISVSRQTGSVKAPFRSLTLRDAKFTMTLRLRNFELWQAGLLGHLFEDLGAGRVPLGSGKNKGFGRITAKARAMKLTYYGEDRGANGSIPGVADAVTDQKRHAQYGWRESTPISGVSSRRIENESSLWRHTRSIDEPAAFWMEAKKCFTHELWKSFPALAATGASGDRDLSPEVGRA